MGAHGILSYDLPCPAQQAFLIYVQEIHTWWPGHLSADPATFVGLHIEPWTGGRVYATYDTGAQTDWGAVIWLDPGRALRHTLGIPHLSPVRTAVMVSFEDHDTGSRMSFRHEESEGTDVLNRTKFGQWPLILGEFVETVRATRRLS